MILAPALVLLLASPLTLPTPDVTVRVRDKGGKLVRSMSRRAAFLRAMGHADGKVPKGYAVDHHVSLACGGADVPSNFQLLSVPEWKAKTRWERRPCSAWWDGTNARLMQWAVAGCATGRTPEELCGGRSKPKAAPKPATRRPIRGGRSR